MSKIYFSFIASTVLEVKCNYCRETCNFGYYAKEVDPPRAYWDKDEKLIVCPECAKKIPTSRPLRRRHDIPKERAVLYSSKCNGYEIEWKHVPNSVFRD